MRLLCSSTLALCLGMFSTAVVAQDTAPDIDVLWPNVLEGPTPDPDASRHILFDRKLHGVLCDLLLRSPSFRRQWRLLASSQRVEVRLRLVRSSPLPTAHSVTTFTALPNGALLAETAIPVSERIHELLGHEVEHVLEHLDGVSVHVQHALGDASVRFRAGTFETARAVLVGRQVSAEFHRR